MISWSDYKLEASIAFLMFIVPVLLNLVSPTLNIEWKILSFVIGAFSIIPIMFIIYEEKYKRYYIQNFLGYKGANIHIFEFLHLWIESQEVNSNIIKCSICLQEKFVINLLQRKQIVKWDAVDGMSDEFWKTDKDSLFINTLLKTSVKKENLKRIKDKEKQYDFAIATLQDGTKIVFSEILNAQKRNAEIFFDKSDINNFETRLLSFY